MRQSTNDARTASPFFNLFTTEKHQEQATKVVLLPPVLMNSGMTH